MRRRAGQTRSRRPQAAARARERLDLEAGERAAGPIGRETRIAIDRGAGAAPSVSSVESVTYIYCIYTSRAPTQIICTAIFLITGSVHRYAFT